MTNREQELLEEIERFKYEARELTEEIDQLWDANAALCLERDATDQLLGEALDLLARHVQDA